MQPIAFIRQLPPFDQLGEEDLLTVAQALQPLPVAAGAVLLVQGGAPSAYLYIVGSGSVERRSGGQVVQLLGPGDCFGFPSMLSQEAPIVDAVVAEPGVIYQLPEAIFRQLLDRAPFAQHFLHSLSDRLRSAVRAEEAVSELGLAAPLRHLLTRSPIFVEPTATVQAAAQVMTAANVSSVLVADDPPGILTDRDLRRRVVAAGLPPATPVSQVQSRPLRTLDADAPVHAALLLMLEAGIHHVALAEEGQILGLVTPTDLLRHQSYSPIFLQRELQSLQAGDSLEHYGGDVARTCAALAQSGMTAAPIGRIISALNDTLIQRLVRLAEHELGTPPTPYAWIVFGSEGRAEQMLLTDQDNALVYGEETPAAAAYFSQLAQRVVDGLLRAGFPPCPGGYMATNWCKPLAEWIAIFERWVRMPEPQALMAAGIFFDFRAVQGALSLVPLEHILREAQRNGIFIAHLVRAANDFAPPLGFFNRIRSEDGAIDIKKGGIAPIVGLARALALAAGSQERSTLERLAAARAANRLSAEGADDLGEAFQFFLHVRLRRQLAAIESGQAPDNRILLKELTPREQRLLKDAFVRVRQLQDAIGNQLLAGGI